MSESDGTLRFVDVAAQPYWESPRRSDLGRYEFTHKGEVTRVHALTPLENLYEIQLLDGGRSFHFRPGQFLMLEVPGVGEAPFSISSSPLRHGAVELCIRKVGTLTRFLARAQRGMQVGIRGPFGNYFPMEDMHGHNILLIAGGMGLAPLRSAISYVQDNRSRFKEVFIVYGARNPSLLLFKYLYDWWRQDDMQLELIVEQADESWKGPVGLITQQLEVVLGRAGVSCESTYATVCGPPVMFKYVCNMLYNWGIPMQRMFVSLERRMHCGMGKCCRCNVGSTYTCLSGPIFDYWSVMNLAEAI